MHVRFSLLSKVSSHPGHHSLSVMLLLMLKWQFQIMREPKCSCLQLNPQIEGFSEAEHASVHFTALKEKQHIFFYRISPTQTEIQSCCASSEENV